uniref:Ig-like domain-containing protein n=1 Tax=Dicentrarchus labrax TaxID=13489 RepID=A0A8C4GTT4_DICLA
MQESTDPPPSLSQLLRESYLAEARAQQRHSEMSRSDASSSRLQIYGSLKGKAEDSVGHHDPQFPDLSAFLSQEELDKSVNLACQAIGHEPREERAEVKASVVPLTSFSEPPSAPMASPSPAPVAAPSSLPFTQPLPETGAPYGPETQSKKEFLNKAADFIEELSSLFKANSSKRVRPRACKTHRSRSQNKKVQLDSGIGHVEFQDCRITEEQHYDSVTQEVAEEEEEEAGSCALTETTYPVDPVCEPPHFIQKLKSREVPEGSNVQLDCIVRGLPVPEVRWFCEGKELENSPDIQIVTDGELHSLIIAEAFEEDTGRYSCFASNFYGTDSTSAEIYVEGDEPAEQLTNQIIPEPPLPVQTSVAILPVPELPKTPVASTSQTSNYNYLQGLNGQPIMAAPVFTKNLQDLLTSEGQLVVLECRVKGMPSPRVDWYREGKIIDDSPDFRILQKKPRSPAESEEICTLVIAEVFSEDSGMFTCTASNKYGTVSSTATLRVKGNASVSLHISNGSPIVVPLPDPPPNSCLKTGTLTNHKDSRSSSRVGLRVHFKLPEDEEDEQRDTSSLSDEDINQMSLNKEPPPVRAKPKLDPAQLQILHNQVLMEQQQETEPQTQTHVQPQSHPPIQVQIQPEVQSSHEGPPWSPRMQREPNPPPFKPYLNTTMPPQQTTHSAPPLTTAPSSPTSPPSLVSSPTPLSAAFMNSMFAVRAQSPPQASSPTSSSSTPSPIQNPVAFLSSVLPSLTPSQPTNSMGLPRGAPLGLKKTVPKVRFQSTEDIRESKELLIHDIEKKLRSKDDTPQFAHQQEYKVSNFEQRLMSEIEFRLERTPVEESDDEVQHDDVPTGRCIAPIFDKKLKNFRAMEGVPVTLSCKIVGVPVPKVYWFKDGKQILRKNVHYKKIREGDGTCALHIESTTNDDDGNYTIMAANPQGRISCSGHLIVQTGPPRNRLTPIHSQRVRTRIQEVESEQTEERFFRPHFLQAPGDMLAHEGRLCRLDCKVSGLPNPELMWLVNGRPIYPDLYHKMLVRENGIHSLVIDPLTQNDAGTYTCIASNKAGQSSFNLELKVVEKEMKHPPQFLEKLQNMGIPEGTPVRLECRVVGMPPPVIFWKKDNDTIPKTKDRISMTQDATGYVCLLIQPTRKDDAGWYTVSAKNEAGIVSCTCRIDIYAQWHQSIPAPMKKAQRTGSRYAALTGQGLDIKSAFPTSDTSPILFSSSPPEVMLESEEL